MAGKRKPKARTSKNVDEKYLGSEPSFIVGYPLTDSERTRAYNWYNYFVDLDTGLKWLVEWAKSVNHPDFDRIKNLKKTRVVPTAYWIARMILRGYNVSTHSQERLEQWIKEALDLAPDEPDEEEEKKPQKPSVSPMVRIEAKSNELIAHLETVLDEFYETKEPLDFNTYDWLRSVDANFIHGRRIAEHYGPLKAELDQAFLKKDKELTEAYHGYTKKQLGSYLALVSGIIDDATRFADNQNAVKVRKPRVIRAKPPEKMVEKVRYKKENTALKIVSVSPTRILGAKVLWTYNDKSRKLSVYHALDGQTLSIDGTKVTNYDPAASVVKGVRSPEKTIAAFNATNKVGLRKFMDTLTTKAAEANPRLTEDTILLKAE
jgi:hypothetical protein